jgi:hypothetical protein
MELIISKIHREEPPINTTAIWSSRLGECPRPTAASDRRTAGERLS